MLGIVSVITIFVNRCQWKNYLYGELGPHLTFRNLIAHSREGDTVWQEIFLGAKLWEMLYSLQNKFS